MTGCYQNYIIRTVLLSAYFRNAQFTNKNVNGTFVYLSYRVLMFMFEVANDILLQSLSKVQAVGDSNPACIRVLLHWYLAVSID